MKVCLPVEDAAQLIQPGDIMIARSTDIAWSPLFPMLGGVVTELGGLVSHGILSGKINPIIVKLSANEAC